MPHHVDSQCHRGPNHYLIYIAFDKAVQDCKLLWMIGTVKHDLWAEFTGKSHSFGNQSEMPDAFLILHGLMLLKLIWRIGTIIAAPPNFHFCGFLFHSDCLRHVDPVKDVYNPVLLFEMASSVLWGFGPLWCKYEIFHWTQQSLPFYTTR